jgi:gas vesicle protein
VARRKPEAPQIAFFIVNHGIPTVSIGFSNEQSVLFGGILSAISSLTSSETGMGMLDDIQAEKGRIFIQNVGHDSLVGFFIWSKTHFAKKIESQIKVLAGVLGNKYLSDYIWNPAFEEILMVGALPERFQVKLCYQAVVAWRKQVRHSPFRETDTLEKLLLQIDRDFITQELGLSLTDLTYAEKIENVINEAVWLALGSLLKNDMSILLTARKIESIIPTLRSKIKSMISEEISRQGPAALLKQALTDTQFHWPVSQPKQVTAGLLLKEFISGYVDNPFGEQGLVITKQLLDLAFPKKKLNVILQSSELIQMLTEEEAHFNFRKNPFFNAFLSFLIELTPKTIKPMKGDQLKKELTKLISRNRPLPSLEIDRVYDLSGNPETATYARKSLENALIKTTSSLLSYLLIGNDSNVGKVFSDLTSYIVQLAERVEEVNYLTTFLNGFFNYKWRTALLNGCLPTLQELNTKNLCEILKTDPGKYIKQFEENNYRKLAEELHEPLLSVIERTWSSLQSGDPTIDVEMNFEYPDHKNITSKVLNRLQKLSKKVKSKKSLNEQEINSIKENVKKEIQRLEERISKEIRGFEKTSLSRKVPEPPWFKYTQSESGWQVPESSTVLNNLKTIFTLENLFSKKDKESRKAYAVFEQLNGIHFAIEMISAHYFYDQIPSKLLTMVEHPAEHNKNQAIKSLREMRYTKGVTALRDYLVSNAGLVTSLLSQGFASIKDSYFKNNPEVLMNDEDLQNPNYLHLMEFPREILEDVLPEVFFGDNYFNYLLTQNTVKFGFHLSKWKGRGNDLYELLISSSSLENAYLYKQATKVLGHFSGYVYSAAVGNLQVCPSELIQINDLFL